MPFIIFYNANRRPFTLNLIPIISIAIFNKILITDSSVIINLKCYCWSSPVAFYNDQNEMFVFFGDVLGNVYLIKGKTGEIVATAKIGTNFEASPIVVDNKIIIGSRGNKIYKLSLQ